QAGTDRGHDRVRAARPVVGTFPRRGECEGAVLTRPSPSPRKRGPREDCPHAADHACWRKVGSGYVPRIQSVPGSPLSRGRAEDGLEQENSSTVTGLVL